MTTLQVWSEFFTEHEKVNIVQLEDKSFWFQFSHLCKMLEYKNPTVALQTHCEDYEIRKMDTGQHEKVNFVSESGFYSLVLGSQKPKAKQFKKWICTDVLPKLRASGAYIMPNTTSEQLQAALNEIVALNDKVASSNRRALQWHEELDRFKLGHRTIRQFLHDCTTSFDKEGSGCLLYELYGVFRHWSNTMYMIKAVKPEHFKQMLHEMYGDPVIFDGDGRWPGLKIKSQYRSIASRSLPIKDLT